MAAVDLPPGVRVFERGWLSSNNIFILGEHGSALIDSGYCTHAAQTCALVDSALQGEPLDLLLNTHLHSDHCGGNAALQMRYPGLKTLIPPGHAECVRAWDANALSYTPSGQQCPQFAFTDVLQPATEVLLGDRPWQVHAAPGHDPHSVILFEPVSRTLVSADALWERGFGVVFPELDGERAFEEVSDTLDLIESLHPQTVIPGHGAPFADIATSLAYARKRLAGFVQNPAKHHHYAAKVLLKFKLLEAQSLEREALLAWALGTSYFAGLLAHGSTGSADVALGGLLHDLVSTGAARLEGSRIVNA